MASVLHADSAIIRPSMIPVRIAGYSSRSASKDSDGSSKSESKTKTAGKSKLPVAVKTTPAKRVVPSSKPAGASARSGPLPEKKNSAKGVQQDVVAATVQRKTTTKDGDTGAKTISKPIKKIPSRAESFNPIKPPSASVDKARCTGSRPVPGIKNQGPVKTSSNVLTSIQLGILRPSRKFKTKRVDGLPEEEQVKSSSGIGRKSSFRNIHQNKKDRDNKPKKASPEISTQNKDITTEESTIGETFGELARKQYKHELCAENLPQHSMSETCQKEERSIKKESAILKASDKAGKKDGGTRTSKAPDRANAQSSGNQEDNKRRVGSGSNSVQSNSAGGSGDDDPNDPKKPIKNPQDKEEEEEEEEEEEDEEKQRAKKKRITSQIIAITDRLFQDEYQGAVATAFENKTKKTVQFEEGAFKGPLQEDSLQINALSQKTAATQTDERGNVETLHKTIRSKNEEIKIMQNLVDNCRKDYEELQESFNKYTEEFSQVDQNRAMIKIVTNQNNIIQQENLKLKHLISHMMTEVTKTQEKNKKIKNKISKMEVDLGFLETEKMELLKKLKLYESGENVQPQTPGEKTEQLDKDSMEHGLSRTCSLQDVEIMKVEEENLALKIRLEQCEASLKEQRKICKDAKEKLNKQAQNEKQLKSKNQMLKDENDILNSKCSQLIKQWKDVSIGERIQDLRKLQAVISEARTDLASDDTPLQYTSSPLSVELAETGQDGQVHHPDRSQASELHTLINSMTAMVEDLREEISNIKGKLAKAFSGSNHDLLDKEKNEQEVWQLSEKLAALHEKLEDENARSKTLEYMIQNSNTENDQLHERIEELDKESHDLRMLLSDFQEDHNQALATKDRELTNLKLDIQKKDKQRDFLVVQHQMLLEGNDALRTTLENQYSNLKDKKIKIKELKSEIDELEADNDHLRKQLSQQKQKLLDVKREKIERNGLPNKDLEDLHSALQDKIESMNDVLNNVEEISANNSLVDDHPCASAMSKGMKTLSDISRLLRVIAYSCWNAIGCCVCGGQPPEQSTDAQEAHLEESRQPQLEIMIDELKQQLEKLNEENQRLQDKLAEESHAEEIHFLKDQLKESYIQSKQLQEQVNVLQNKNATLAEFLDQVRQEAVQDKEAHCRQTETHVNQIQRLQKNCQNQTRLVNDLKEDLSQYKKKNQVLDNKIKEIVAEKQDLQHQLEAFGDHELRKDKGIFSDAPSPPSDESTSRLIALQAHNEELNNKIEIYEAFFEQVKQEKRQIMKTLEATRESEKMVRNKSDEKLEELEKKLEEKDLSENRLQEVVTSLEERIASLEDEKHVIDKEMKAVVETMQGKNELEKCKKEWNQLELELRNSIQALTLEKTDAQKELEEQKLAMVKVSESLEMRMKELDECSKDRSILQEEVAGLKSTHAKQVKKMKKMMKKKKKMIEVEGLQQTEREVELAQENSSDIIDELEKRLKERQDSEEKLKERAKTLSQQVKQLETEKLQNDQKVHALMASMKAQELQTKTASEEPDLKDKLSEMEVRISELVKEKQDSEEQIQQVKKQSQEKISSFEKRPQQHELSEANFQEKVQSLEFRVQKLRDDKTERNENMKTLMEAMDANINIQEQLKNKEQVERELTKKIKELRIKFSRVRLTKKYLQRQLLKRDSELLLLSRKSKRERQKLEDDLDECNSHQQELLDRLKKLKGTEENTCQPLLPIRDEICDDKTEDRKKQDKLGQVTVTLGDESSPLDTNHREHNECMAQLQELIGRLNTLSEEKRKMDDMLKEKESQAILAKKTSDEKIKDLQNQLDCKNQNVQELKERMAALENEISRLEAEKFQNNNTISNILTELKANEDLAQAIKARDQVEKEYNSKIKDMELKERCIEYTENLRILKENVNTCNERVKDLQATLNGNVRGDSRKQAHNSNLNDSIEDLKRELLCRPSILSLNTSNTELSKALESLNQKISDVEVENHQHQKVIVDMLKSLQDKEKIKDCKKCLEEKDADALMEAERHKVGEAVKGLDKKTKDNDAFALVQEEMLNKRNDMTDQLKEEIEKLRSTLQIYEKEKEGLQIKAKKFANLSEKQQQQEKELRYIIDSLSNQVSVLEEEKQNMIQESSKVVESLNMELGMQSNRERELQEHLEYLENEIVQLRKELEDREQRQVDTESEIKTIKSENENVYAKMKEKTSEMREEIMKHERRENDLKEGLESATNSNTKLALEVDQLKKDVQKVRSENSSLSCEMLKNLSTANDEMLSHIRKENDLKMQLESARMDEKKMVLEVEQLTNENEKLRTELENVYTNMMAKVSNMNSEVMKHLEMENDLKVQMEQARKDKQTLMLEVDELNQEKLSSATTSRQLLDEMKKKDQKQLEQIDELKMTIMNLERENKRTKRRLHDYTISLEAEKKEFVNSLILETQVEQYMQNTPSDTPSTSGYCRGFSF